MPNHNDWIEIGRILKPFGIKGDVKIRFYIDSKDDLKNVSQFYIKDKKAPEGFKALTLKSLKFEENPENAKISFEEIADRTIAEQWRLIPVFVKNSELSEPGKGEFFIKDLLGMEVLYNQENLGSVVNMINVGGQDLFILKLTQEKQELVVPFTERYVQEVQLQDRKIIFQNIDELL